MFVKHVVSLSSFCVEHTKSLTAARHNLSRKRKPPASILMDSLAQYKRHKVDQGYILYYAKYCGKKYNLKRGLGGNDRISQYIPLR